MTDARIGNDAESVPLEIRHREGITQWVEANIGGRVSGIERLRRWRPVWRVDYEKNGVSRAVLVRGLRPWESIPYSLEHEMRLMRVLEANGIAVPHVYGMMEFPKAFAMDWAEGDRDPGLVQQAIEGASTISPERWAASLKYMEILAKMHAIPVERFAGTEAGNPVGARAIALDSYERNYKLLADRNAVDALIAFFTLWLRRNVPEHRTKAAFVTGDCGQFLSRGEEITAILDLEIGHIGDPLHDLACFRGRHPVENMGDVPALFRRYAEITGEALDLPVIAYHTVCFLALATIGPLLALVEKHPGGDWVEGIMQLAFIGRRTLEAMAEIVGVQLDDLALPERHVTPLEDLAVEKLLAEMNRLPTSEIFHDWQRGVLASLPRFLQNQAHYGRWAEEEDLKEIGELLGRRPANLIDADRALKAYVQMSGPDQDARLIKLFHRRILRLCLVLAGPDAPKDHLLFIKVEPILEVPPTSRNHA
jgi:aminoglycoside phosphotransferase (APT) family kinase protein